jgi:hypothetical protein
MIEIRNLREINFTHPTRTKWRTDFVVAKTCACAKGHLT